MNPIAQEYYNRVKDAVERNSALGRMSDWLQKHTTLGGKPYSVKGHEWQVDLLNSTHPNQVVIKPSQMGCTETAARMALGFISVSRSLVALLLLPTVGEAQRFAKSRLDDIIEGSKYMSENLVAGADSSSFKKIGSSQIFLGGTWGKSVISIPVSLLIIDERDFCNQENCKTAESRLSHSPLHNEELDIRGIRRTLSTPTVPSYGISALYEKSDQKKRLCKCKSCGDWVWPSYFDIVIPGADIDLKEATDTDISNLEARGLVDKAKLLCPSCHNELTKENLGPEYRQWVAEVPSQRLVEGFALCPLDLPGYHSPQSLLRKRIEYEDQVGHFHNFTLGMPYASSSNSILVDAVKNNKIVIPEHPETTTASGCVAGLDVGKTSWLVIAKPYRINGEVELHVVWLEQIRINVNDEESLVQTVALRLRQFRCTKAVCDSMPFTSDMMRLQGLFLPGTVFLNSYTLNDKKLPNYLIDEKTYEVKSNRTKVIDKLVKAVNTNKVKFPMLPETDTLAKHLQGMKRVDRIEEDGSIDSSWQKVSADHYMHAMTYCSIAANMVEAGIMTDVAPPVSIRQAFVGRGWEARQSGILTRI